MNKILILILLLSFTAQAEQQKILPAEQSAQFISYWKSHVVTSLQDERVVLAEKVYDRLLRAWDSSRLEPGLFVVDSESGPWAASLVDGNILLSLQALQIISSFGEQRAEHLLAFVLAHELAHQRSDDLWQHRFFNVDQEQQDALDLQLDKRALADMQQKEERADYDGLILMSSVGFNPYQVIGKKDFFTEWVENIWLKPCDHQQDPALSEACHQAKSRALRTHSQLDLVASQSSLYDLGIQALVANDYHRARYYFTQYGRDFPNRAVMSALGLSLLTEAIQIRKNLIQQGLIKSPDFFYPLILDASAGTPSDDNNSLKRATVDKWVIKQQAKISNLAEQAVTYFDKAIRLQPGHKNSYLSLASAYLLSDNNFMARGVIQGRYIPRFGTDQVSDMLLAMTSAVEGKTQQAIKSLHKLVQLKQSDGSDSQDHSDLFRYSVVYNLASLLNFNGKNNEAIQHWKAFAKSAQSTGNAYLFRLALAQLQTGDGTRKLVLKQSPTVNGLRLGNKKTRDDSAHSINELWIEGEQFHVYNYFHGAQFITGSDGKIIRAKQQAGSETLGNILKIGDDASRPIKALGLPDRRFNLVAGEYLAYDQYRLALHIDGEEVKGWFLY